MARTWVPKCPPLLIKFKGRRKAEHQLEEAYTLYTECQADLDKTMDPDDAEGYSHVLWFWSTTIYKFTGIQL